MKNLFDVTGKVAAVTGGSSGIGFMMAQGLLENGAKVYITARKIERLKAAEKALSEFGDCTACLLYTSPSPRDRTRSRMPSSA